MPSLLHTMSAIEEEKLNEISSLVFQYKFIKPKEIPFSENVRNACKMNYCGLYNKNWSCPPNIGELSELIKKCKNYSNALVFTTVNKISDSFDFEGMMKARLNHDSVQNKVIKILDFNQFLLLGAGGCRLCEKCNFPNPCRHPKERVSSVESHGIDVVTLASKISLNYFNGENTVTYFSIIFF